MLIPAEIIREMTERAHPGPWKHDGYANVTASDEKMRIYNEGDHNAADADLIAAAPDLAQTALELYARVEEMEKELKAALPILPNNPNNKNLLGNICRICSREFNVLLPHFVCTDCRRTINAISKP